MLEDRMLLRKEVLKQMKKAEEDLKKGKVVKLENLLNE